MWLSWLRGGVVWTTQYCVLPVCRVGCCAPVRRADPNLCWAKCNATASCLAWAYAPPSCDAGSAHKGASSGGDPLCWLKNEYGSPAPSPCRVSGAQAGSQVIDGYPIAAAVTYTING